MSYPKTSPAITDMAPIRPKDTRFSTNSSVSKNARAKPKTPREKAKREISVLFKDNEKIYSKILSEEFRVWKLPEIVKVEATLFNTPVPP